MITTATTIAGAEEAATMIVAVTTITDAEEAATMIVAVTMITDVEQTVILIEATILTVIMIQDLNPALIPDRMTIPTADVTISSCNETALSFWLTGRKGNVKLIFGTNLGVCTSERRKT